MVQVAASFSNSSSACRELQPLLSPGSSGDGEEGVCVVDATIWTVSLALPPFFFFLQQIHSEADVSMVTHEFSGALLCLPPSAFVCNCCEHATGET